MLKLKTKVIIGVFALVLVTAAVPVCDYLVNMNAPNTSADTLEDEFAVYSYSLVSGGIMITDINTKESNVTDLVIPSKIEGLAVERLDSGAFLNATSLENITLPTKIAVISDTAFNRLPNLKSINVDPVNQTFASDGCSLYTKDMRTLVRVPMNADYGDGFTFPDSVVKIGARAFYGCKNITSVKTSANIAEISDFAFAGTTALSKIELSANATKISQNAFAEAAALSSILVDEANPKYSSDGVALYSKQKILIAYPAGRTNSSYKVKDGTISIGLLAFSNATNLKSITFAGTEQQIQSSAFSGSGLQTLSIPAHIEQIQDSAFSNCPYLKTAAIEGKDTSIGAAAFSNCTALESFTFNDFMTSVDMAMFLNDTALKEVHLPSSLTTINEAAFTGCTSLTDIKLPGQLKQIKSGAFLQTGITNFNIPGSVSIIEDTALGLAFNIDEDFSVDENVDYGELMGLIAKTITVSGYSTVNNKPGVVKDFCDKNEGFVFKDLGNFTANNWDITGDGTATVAELKEIIRVVLGQKVSDAYNEWLSAEADKKGFTTSDLAAARRNLILAFKNAKEN